MDIALGDDVPALCTRRCDLLAALNRGNASPELIRLGHEFESFEQLKRGIGFIFAEAERQSTTS